MTTRKDDLNLNGIINVIRKNIEGENRRIITGRNKAAAALFKQLFRLDPLPHGIVMLCADDGLILYFSARESNIAPASFTLNLNELAELCPALSLSESLGGYVLITTEEEESEARRKKFAEIFKAFISILDEYGSESFRLLSAFNAVDKSVSVFDKNANLLFANENFCNYLYTPPQNRNGIIGKSIETILKEAGTSIQSIEASSSRLKMYDVLEKGEKVIDWEIRVTSSDGDSMMVGNDMYPVFSENGEIEGMVEITHSRQQQLSSARKFVALSAEYSFEDIIGSSSGIKSAIRTAKDYADSPLSLLITGESGVGKELFAQAVHNYSSRREKPFVVVNCASFPENLFESELFGYIGGAFTGASKGGQMGKFELANNGTLFLDEVGELPYHFQAKLLRVLETQTVTRIGSTKPFPVNVRIIAATNRNLAEMVEKDLFRQDLFYRLQILSIEIPPLRDRRDDVILLSEELLKREKKYDGGTPKSLTDDAKKILSEYIWPGNVRELRNILYRASLLSKTKFITKEDLNASFLSGGLPSGAIEEFQSVLDSGLSAEARLAQRKHEVDVSNANLLKEAISIAKGNRTKAAEILGLSRNTLYRMLRKYNIE